MGSRMFFRVTTKFLISFLRFFFFILCSIFFKSELINCSIQLFRHIKFEYRAANQIKTQKCNSAWILLSFFFKAATLFLFVATQLSELSALLKRPAQKFHLHVVLSTKSTSFLKKSLTAASRQAAEPTNQSKRRRSLFSKMTLFTLLCFLVNVHIFLCGAISSNFFSISCQWHT